MIRLFRESREVRNKTRDIRSRIEGLIKEATVNHDPYWFRKVQLDEKTAECIDQSIFKCLEEGDKEARK